MRTKTALHVFSGSIGLVIPWVVDQLIVSEKDNRVNAYARPCTEWDSNPEFAIHDCSYFVQFSCIPVAVMLVPK